jgi:2-polyprenyl-6-methoxyphenol hydroxylase-like FAD-dependent oxidoreductase
VTKAIVVGGGIGGLTAAISLRRVGVEVVVLEKAGELREVGAGISLWTNAVKVMKKLGLHGAVRAAGAAEIGGEIRSWRGEKISELSADELRLRFGEPNLAVHRADLQGTLMGALPEGTVWLGAEHVRFIQDDEGVVACLADGHEERGDLLIGADGINSCVRAQLLGRSEPRYAGYTAWRGIATPSGTSPEGVAILLWGRGSEFGLVSIGRGRFYWFLTKNASEGETRDAAVRKREVLDLLRGWYEPARAVVEATEESKILRNDIYDRAPLKRWGKGRVTLLGDAAHPMRPNLGQGACQAMEDAVVLAQCLEGGSSAVVPALRLYESRRVGRARSTVKQSRLAGRIAQLQNPLLCHLRDALAKKTSARAQLRWMAKIVEYEA